MKPVKVKPSRPKTHFVCQECGFQGVRWSGRCPECAQWNTLREEVDQMSPLSPRKGLAGSMAEPLSIESIVQAEEFRMQSGLGELNRVLGGGVVPGSVILIGGDPGIGKTTLLLQTLASL
ncbi:MAG: DNA repair protein RadA, partial [Nitrospira sp.]|nr:DNA repair protein RadA [Nitrospira sp.]